MKHTPRLYNTLVALLNQTQWQDRRHLFSCAWMVFGLLSTTKIHISEWASTVVSRANYAQSHERRLRRWLSNRKINPQDIYRPLIQHAIRNWGTEKLYLALDTSMLWNKFCLIRLAIVYRGRSVPLCWKLIKHKSAMVKLSAYQDMLNQSKQLLPPECEVVFLADRGFMDIDLMTFLSRTMGWHWRIRFKRGVGVYRKTKSGFASQDLRAYKGEARFYRQCYVTREYFGPVHIAFGKPKGVRDEWIIVSDEPTSVETFNEYGLRFDIEESFLDDKSNGFQLESSGLRKADDLNRLCLVLAVATLFLVAQGTEVVATKLRRRVDPHWKRRLSYLKIGWRWLRQALVRGWKIIQHFVLSGISDPEPNHRNNLSQKFSTTQTIVLGYRDA